MGRSKKTRRRDLNEWIWLINIIVANAFLILPLKALKPNHSQCQENMQVLSIARGSLSLKASQTSSAGVLTKQPLNLPDVQLLPSLSAYLDLLPTRGPLLSSMLNFSTFFQLNNLLSMPCPSHPNFLPLPGLRCFPSPSATQQLSSPSLGIIWTSRRPAPPWILNALSSSSISVWLSCYHKKCSLYLFSASSGLLLARDLSYSLPSLHLLTHGAACGVLMQASGLIDELTTLPTSDHYSYRYSSRALALLCLESGAH